MKPLKSLGVVILCFSMLVLLLAGCSQTPEQDIVVSKESGVGAGQAIGSSDETSESSESEKDGSMSFTNEAGTVNFQIDDMIENASCDTVSVKKAQLHYLTADEIERISQVMLGNVTLFEYTEVRTKEQLEALILEKKQAAVISEEDLQALVDAGECKSLEEAYARYENYQQLLLTQIEALEADYANAPIQAEEVPTDFSFHEDSYYSSGNSDEYTMFASADWLQSVKATAVRDGVPYFIWCAKCEDTDHLVSTLYIYPHIQDTFTTEWNYYQTEPLSEEEQLQAKNIVDEFLASIDLGEWAIEQAEYKEYETEGSTKKTYAMVFDCTPIFDGIPLTDAKGTYSYTESYRSNCTSTDLRIYVSGGQIMTVCLDTPLEITEASSAEGNVMSFDEIFPYIKNQLTNKFTLGYLSDIINGGEIKVQSATVCVSEAQLKYVRTLVKGSESEYYMMPAWVLYGHVEENGDELLSGEWPTEVLLVINAMDGSAIDLTQGY